MSINEQLILESIIYSDVFDWPLRQKEILAQIRNPKSEILKLLIKKKVIAEKDGFYFLPGKEYLIKKRLQREKWAEKKIKIAKKAAGFLKIIPGILLVGVSGGLSVGNVARNDDIDFFIVCKNNNLWTSRFFSTIILDMLFLRRKPKQKNFKDKICLNMFVDEIGFSQLDGETDIFTQHELQQLKILWQRKTNNNYKLQITNDKSISNIKYPRPRLRFAEGGQISNENFVEEFLKHLQLKIMKNKITYEKIEKHKLMFHPADAKKWVLEKYHKKLLTLAKVV